MTSEPPERLVMAGIDNIRIETLPKRPPCTVWCSNIFDCHIHKMSHYAPTNCDCTPTACSCAYCIQRHVEHCVEDYKDAIARVRLGITKLRAKPRTEGGGSMSNMYAFSRILSRMTLIYSRAISSAADGNCEMPGVRKAKHLKGYTKAQKEAYNRGK